MGAAGDCNILIAGAGPVGLAAALELSRRGFAVRIIEKGEDFTPIAQSRALGVNNRTLQLLGPSGVSDALLDVGNRVTHLSVYNERGRRSINVDFKDAGAPFPFMLVVPQGRTERLLAEALADYGVTVEWNAEAIDVNGDLEKPAVDINRPGGVDTIRADLVIGADGAGSIIRRAFGFSFEGEGIPVEFGLADLELEGDFDQSEVSVRYSRDGALGCIPIGRGVYRFVAPRPNITQSLPEGLNIKQVVWRSSFRVNFRHVGSMQKGNVFLAGDAAHVHSPAGARGMNLGIEDACWLAWLIEEGRAADYSTLRLPEVRKVIAQTKTQTRGLFAMNIFERFARDRLAAAALEIAPFKRKALTRITGLDTADPPWLG